MFATIYELEIRLAAYYHGLDVHSTCAGHDDEARLLIVNFAVIRPHARLIRCLVSYTHLSFQPPPAPCPESHRGCLTLNAHHCSLSHFQATTRIQIQTMRTKSLLSVVSLVQSSSPWSPTPTLTTNRTRLRWSTTSTTRTSSTPCLHIYSRSPTTA